MPKVKQGSQGERWCFTLNNYTEKDVASITEKLTFSNCVFAKVGKEIGDSGTPHLQGFIHLRKRLRLACLKKLVGDRAHCEVARGTDKDNESYCGKDSDVVLTIGEPTIGTTEQGGGDTIHSIARRIALKLSKGTDITELQGEEWKAYCRHSKVIQELSAALVKNKNIKDQAAQMSDKPLRTWQKELKNAIQTVPDDRKVMWYCDSVGNTGKTWFSKYLVALHGAIRFENGKSADIKYAYNGERVVVFDLSRSQVDHFNYEVIESIKNGLMFSPKYTSCTKMYPIPHVIVFANWMSDESKLSADRWKIESLSDVSKIKCEKEDDVIVNDVIVIEDDDVQQEQIDSYFSNLFDNWGPDCVGDLDEYQ
ncbi:replication-associated protein [Dragonfly larvae associated circular virus-10]|uniref:Replication-associated protein n=1 Tax=Dragonfly larvae associated circular virus-10 TaxID=1454022 RepID=W5U288_9VIRU|nr:replication-associated protein [Dragonfly larvae associated circular virus-10]AHH31485.1 replication-associated protein [Dragonfly larvae associated circular virus-10]